MNEETRKKISESVKLAFAKKKSAIVDEEVREDVFDEENITPIRMADQSFPPDLFRSMETGKPIDLLFTEDGGVPKACNYMLIGDPGIGKSTVSLDIISDLALEGYNVLFISAEMTRIDLHKYVQRYPKFGLVNVIFVADYLDTDPKKFLKKSLDPGYDIVLIDSFAELQSHLKESSGISTNTAEKWITTSMLKHNSGKNKSQTNTTFICIQQVTKDGVQLGTNRLKHAMTGMIELRKDKETGDSYIEFTKNRRGELNKRMYYSLSVTGDVRYNLNRFIEEIIVSH